MSGHDETHQPEWREENDGRYERREAERRADEQAMGLRAVEVRVRALEIANTTLTAELQDNTRVTASIKEDTADLVAFTQTAKGIVTFGKWLGRIMTWAATIGAACIAIWATVKGIKS